MRGPRHLVFVGSLVFRLETRRRIVCRLRILKDSNPSVAYLAIEDNRIQADTRTRGGMQRVMCCTAVSFTAS